MPLLRQRWRKHRQVLPQSLIPSLVALRILNAIWTLRLNRLIPRTAIPLRFILLSTQDQLHLAVVRFVWTKLVRRLMEVLRQPRVVTAVLLTSGMLTVRTVWLFITRMQTPSRPRWLRLRQVHTPLPVGLRMASARLILYSPPTAIHFLFFLSLPSVPS